MPFKFEKLEVWELALDYIDLIYELAEQLPRCILCEKQSLQKDPGYERTL